MPTKLDYYFSVILNRKPTEYEISAYGQKNINEDLLVKNIRNISGSKSLQEILCKIENHNAYMIFLDLFITKHITHGVENIYKHCIHFYIKKMSSAFLIDYLKYMYNCEIHYTENEINYTGVIHVHLDPLFYTNYHYVLHNLYEVLSCIELTQKCYIDLEYMYNFNVVFNVPKSNNLVFISP